MTNQSSSTKISFNYEFIGELDISGKKVEVRLGKIGNDKSLIKGSIHSDEYLKLKELINALSSNSGDSIPDDISININQLLLIYQAKPKSYFLISLGLDSDINLANLPLVGKEFSREQKLGINNFKLLYSSSEFTLTDNDNIPELKNGNEIKITEGMRLLAQLNLGDKTENLDIAITQKSDKKGTENDGNVNNGTPQALALKTDSQDNNNSNKDQDTGLGNNSDDGVYWYSLKKKLGPVYFQRIGVQYKNSEVWFLLDASMSSSGLTITLDGLAVGSPISKFEPKFTLNGLGIQYESKGNISIGGALLRGKNAITGRDEYNGAVIIKTKTFTLSAIGSYTTTEEGQPSLFIYGLLDKPIGGPPFFFVTGLALGFGYNRGFIPPTVEQVPDFPLVKFAISKEKPDIGNLIKLQKNLSPNIPPKNGSIMLAIGVKFTSFKIIESFVLLVATFGDKFTLDLIGISTLTSPPVTEQTKKVPPIAQVRLAIIARFVPDEGTLKVEGKILPDSYLFERNCQLSGGFAFYTWFSGQYEGDFVLTVGGYHPQFNIPAHYPRVDRISLNWQISNELSVKGSMYFALTASAVMAGGRLEAVWQSGNLKAWYVANANFIVSWKPYFYEADLSVNYDVSYKFSKKIFGVRIHKTLKVEVGADLHIWGPKFSGRAEIHLSIISFTIRFGDRTKKPPTPIEWAEFKQSFLPQENVCSVNIEEGLIRKAEEKLIVNPQGFSFTTNSVIPIKTSGVGQVNNQNLFGIAPMNINSEKFTKSELTISINKIEKDKDDENKIINIDKINDFAFEPIYKNIPTGLWGESNSNNPNSKRFINNVLCGFTIKPKPKDPSKALETQAIERNNLAYDIQRVNNEFEEIEFIPFSRCLIEDENNRQEYIGIILGLSNINNIQNQKEDWLTNIEIEETDEKDNTDEEKIKKIGTIIGLNNINNTPDKQPNLCKSIEQNVKNIQDQRENLLKSIKLPIDIDLEEFQTQKGREQAFIVTPELVLS